MYQPPAFREDRLQVQHALIEAHPLGLLVTAGPGGLMANPIPFLLARAGGPYGTLQGHLARANPQWHELARCADCLVVFQGPQDYVTPSWYASKREHGRVVPTWNFATVHVWGLPAVHEEAEWLRPQVEALTGRHEAGRATPWAVGDAPEDFLAGQLKGIVGVEIPIARIEGKWKMSQNRPEPDRAGVVQGYREAGASHAAIAALVAERNGLD